MDLHRNADGSIIGTNGGIERIAAHTYEVKSNSYPTKWSPGMRGTIFRLAKKLADVTNRPLQGWIDRTIIQYLVYVESICPKVARCECPDAIIAGLCKHCEAAIEFERYVAHLDPEQYKLEKQVQREHLEAGRRRRPYRGSIQDEQITSH